MRDGRDACVNFRLGEDGFGIPLAQVREITAAGPVTPVPLAPPAVRGLTNLRGRVVTLIDVAHIFGRPLPTARLPEERLAVVLAAPYEHLGLYVHAPVEIALARVEAAQPRALAARAGAASAEPVAPARGLAAVSGQVVHLLSAPDLVAHCEARVLEGFRRKS